MKQNLFLFFLYIIALALGGCGDKSSLKGEITPPTDRRAEQLGDEWNRTLIPFPSKYHKSIFAGKIKDYRTGAKNQGNLIYIGEFSNTHFMLTAKHILPVTCDYEYLKLWSGSRSFYIFCTEIFFEIPDSDAVIFSFEFENSEDQDYAEPLSLAVNVNTGEQLKSISYQVNAGGGYEMVSDASKECLLLDENPRLIDDPDQLNTLDASLSLPISCDVQHGDSGGAILNSRDELVGILWTGKFPKNRVWETGDILKQIKSPNISLWEEFNYIVPSSHIIQNMLTLASTL